jgi:hypothetical protein
MAGNPGGETYSTYNAQISSALAALLPVKFMNRERLRGRSLRSWFAGAVLEVVMAEAHQKTP